MQWIHNYQLFLFDFDGLLVNTESVHYQAYLNVCKLKDVQLEWTYPQYCQFAHQKSLGVKQALEYQYPQLFKNESWEGLYQEKKKEYIRLVQENTVELMPGVADLLNSLHKASIKSCVVTNSTKEQVAPVQMQHPILKKIPYWITKEQYTAPKPDPECYRLAMKTHLKKGEMAIGFEDTPRGMKALKKNPLKAVLISSILYPKLQTFIEKEKVSYFPSFENIDFL